MNNDPFGKRNPAFDPDEIDKLQSLKDEAGYLEDMRIGNTDDKDISPDIPPDLLTELIEETDPQSQ